MILIPDDFVLLTNLLNHSGASTIYLSTLNYRSHNALLTHPTTKILWLRAIAHSPKKTKIL
jgi:hypothetical protein